MVADDLHDRRAVRHTHRNRHVRWARERKVRSKHRPFAPVNKFGVHRPGQNERSVVQLLHLQELPYHHRLEHGADTARHDDERVGHEHEVVETCEERAMLERFGHEGIDVLLEGQIDANADRPLVRLLTASHRLNIDDETTSITFCSSSRGTNSEEPLVLGGVMCVASIFPGIARTIKAF